MVYILDYTALQQWLLTFKFTAACLMLVLRHYKPHHHWSKKIITNQTLCKYWSWAIVGSMLGQRRRRWTTIEPTMTQCHVTTIIINHNPLELIDHLNTIGTVADLKSPPSWPKYAQKICPKAPCHPFFYPGSVPAADTTVIFQADILTWVNQLQRKWQRWYNTMVIQWLITVTLQARRYCYLPWTKK